MTELEKDRALLDAFRRGDKAALAQVFRRYAPDVARQVRAGPLVRIEGRATRLPPLPEHDVEAIVQETFLKAFQPRARDSYDGIRPYGAWLSTITRNLLIDRARKVRREALVDDIDETTADLEPPPDPTWRLEEEQIRAVVESARSTLEPLDQQIFALRFVQQKTHKETATALQISEITVRRRDTRIRTRLLDQLRQAGFLKDAHVNIGQSLLKKG